MLIFSVNGEIYSLAVNADMPLLRTLRDIPGLTGRAFQPRQLTVLA